MKSTIEVQKIPNYADAYYNRGFEFETKGDFARAIDDYTQAIQFDPHGETGKKAREARSELEKRHHKAYC